MHTALDCLGVISPLLLSLQRTENGFLFRRNPAALDCLLYRLIMRPEGKPALLYIHKRRFMLLKKRGCKVPCDHHIDIIFVPMNIADHLQLRRFGRRGALRGNLIPARLGLEELPVLLEGFPQSGRLRNLHLVHPHGDLIRPEFLAVKRHIQQPVVFLRIIGQRAIDQVVAGWVVRREQLLGIDVIAASQRQHFRIVEGEPLHMLVELPILVIPDDDPALIEFGQGSRKLAVQVLHDFVCVHEDASRE